MPSRDSPPTRRRLALPPGLAGELILRARRAAPEECCGVLLGRAGRVGTAVVEAAAGANDAPGDRRSTYSIAVPDLLAAHRSARTRGLEVVGYYHSHPAGEPVPSARDRRSALPGASYLIVGLAPEARLASWRFPAGGEPRREVIVEGAREENGAPGALQGETTTRAIPGDER